MSRTVGQVLMLVLVIAGSLLLSFHELLAWEPWVIQWLFGALGLLLLGCCIDGLLVFFALLRNGAEKNQEKKSLKDPNH